MSEKNNQNNNSNNIQKVSLCNICPRRCNVDRSKRLGFCGSDDKIRIARYSLHLWEEPCISGTESMQADPTCPVNGSGTIFFMGCNLRCIYCQNYKISSGISIEKSESIYDSRQKVSSSDKLEAEKEIILTEKDGFFEKKKSSASLINEYTVNELVDIMRELQAKGAANINLVTPTHFSDKIREALLIYKDKQEKIEDNNTAKLQSECRAETSKRDRKAIPIVYNCSGYESVETLKSLEGLVDIYLTDFKYMDNEMAKEFSQAEDYPEVAKQALAEMYRQQPVLEYDELGMLQKGIIVRHLILPGYTRNAKNVIDYLVRTYGEEILISVMNQYTPVNGIENRCPKLARTVTKREYDKVLQFCFDLDTLVVVEIDVFINKCFGFGACCNLCSVNTFSFENRKEIFSQSIVIRIPTS